MRLPHFIGRPFPYAPFLIVLIERISYCRNAITITQQDGIRNYGTGYKTKTQRTCFSLYLSQSHRTVLVVTANRGRKKWFSMRRYGGYGAFKRAVLQRCKWVGAPIPDDQELRHRYDQWARDNETRLRHHGLEP